MLLHSNNTFVEDLVNENVDVLDLILSGKPIIIENEDDINVAIPEDITAILKNCVNHWDMKETRERFGEILEENIPR